MPVMTYARGLFILFQFNNICFSQWNGNPGVNNTICTATGNQYFALSDGSVTPVAIVSDGSGGAIIVWTDFRSDYDIFTQRINSSGIIQWTTNGVAICSANLTQTKPQVIPDGSGGAIIVWEDMRAGGWPDIYAQRINSAGTVQWVANGVGICALGSEENQPQIVPDGGGGAIIVWEDNRGGSKDIYAQRINSAGTAQWTANGVVICTAAGYQYRPQLVSDGSGGAIITWDDERVIGNLDIYAQRINSAGAVQWTADGVAISWATNVQRKPQLVSDGSGGAIITWETNEPGNYNIRAQRISSAGALQWAGTDGAVICTNTWNQYFPEIISDGSGGAIITWHDARGGGFYDIYAQRVNSAGTVQWAANGIGVCTTAGSSQMYEQIASDGSGGAIITWQDYRSGGSNPDIYAQRINSAGTAQWAANGVAISTEANKQLRPDLITSSVSPCSAIITWYDDRNNPSTDNDIYIAGVGCDGVLLPVELISFTGKCDNQEVVLNWQTASEINNNYFTIERSADGKSFDEIGKIDGAGNSSAIHKYEFIDETPLSFGEGQGVRYYRLKQTDYDGKYEYFGPISVGCDAEQEITILPSISNSGYITVTGKEMADEITVYNLLGEKVFFAKDQPLPYVIDISLNSKGIYIVDVKSNDKTAGPKLINFR